MTAEHSYQFTSAIPPAKPVAVDTPGVRAAARPRAQVYWFHPDHLGTGTLITDLEGRSHQFFLNLPYGETFIEQGGHTYDNPYKFNGKELDEETGLYYYGARYYNPKISLWLSVDPLAGVNPDKTPYNYTSNNPVVRIDPTGMVDNPIYGTDGTFLGTDDKGLQGEMIVMNKEDFKQGMSHEEAMKLNKGIDGFLNPDIANQALEHYSKLPDRPDYDGFVTIEEGIEWAKKHPNALQNPTPDNSLYLDASKLNFGNLSVKNIGLKEGEKGNINLYDYVKLFNNKSRATVYALGNTQMKLINKKTGTVKLFWDNYDWDYHHNPPSGLRDRLVQFERVRKGLNDEHGFRVYIYGQGKINQ